MSAPSDATRDAALVQRARAGDAQATRELVRRHLRAAHAVARAILLDADDAEDACQDAFVAVLARLDACEPAHDFRPWLLQCVRNRAISLLRRQRSRHALPLGTGAGEVEAVAPAAADPQAHVERAELRAQLAGALATLPDWLRAVVVLHDVEGWRHEEIALALGVATGTSRSRLFDARRALRARLRAPWADRVTTPPVPLVAPDVPLETPAAPPRRRRA